MRFTFTRTARRHRIGKAHALTALANAGDPTIDPTGDLRWVGTDDRGATLELVGFTAQEDSSLIVIKHVMPTEFRRKL